MVVGFVNAGLMGLNQAIGTILGARIGTTITAQIIAFKISEAALPLIGIGVIMSFFVKRRTYRNLGQAVLGFGLLFLGLNLMSQYLGGLRDNPAFLDMLAAFGQQRFLGVLAGALFTAVIQSSSASVGVIIALGLQGILDLDGALALTLGCCVGTSVTALLASIGTNLSARRSAFAHVLFNSLGALMFVWFLGPIRNLIALTSTDIARQIAWGHTFFAVISTLIFLPFVPVFTRLIKTALPGEEEVIESGQKYLDRRLLGTPSIAMGAAKKEIERMANITIEMVDTSLDILFKNHLGLMEVVERKEEIVDELESGISVYLAELSQQSITPQQGRELANYFHAINDFERIGDHALNIGQLCEERIERKLVFSENAIQDITAMYQKVMSINKKAVAAFQTNNLTLAREVIREDLEVNRLEKQFRDSHISRVNDRMCFPPSGVIFLDIIANLERIGDHSVNIAQAVLGQL